MLNPISWGHVNSHRGVMSESLIRGDSWVAYQRINIIHPVCDQFQMTLLGWSTPTTTVDFSQGLLGVK